MGVVKKVVDSVLFILFLIFSIQIPTQTAQLVLPSGLFPKLLVDLYQWYCNLSGDYLFVEKPPFFVGLAWLDLLFLWPLLLLNLYAIIRTKSWFGKTCLIYGVSAFTSSVAILAELITSTRITGKLKSIYFSFAGIAVLAILRGLLSRPRKTGVAKGAPALGRKKRA